MGLMQLMPQTARQLKVSNPFDPEQNVDAGVRHLKKLMESYGGDVRLTLAAYNAGQGAVARSAGVPHIAETRNYVKRITQLYYGGSDPGYRILGSPVQRSGSGGAGCTRRAVPSATPNNFAGGSEVREASDYGPEKLKNLSRSQRARRLVWPFLLLLLPLQPPTPPVTVLKRWARTQFASAERMREALNGRPATERTRREYQHVINAYRQVYYGAPASTKADPSVVAVAELMVEMGTALRRRQDAALGYRTIRISAPGISRQPVQI